MKMKKRFLTLLMILTCTLTITACGQNNENNPNTEPEQPAATEEVTNAPAETEPAATETPDNTADSTVGQMLLSDFQSIVQQDSSMNAQAIADALISNENIPFDAMTMEVTPGYLTGFTDVDVTGFKEGVCFGPSIGTIPFIGYIFVLKDGTDTESFISTLKDNADLRWNMCTEAEELTVDANGNIVFFLMSPLSFEEQ